MGDHSRLSPSAAERWINCPGSINLSRNAPALPPSVYSAEGTVAHSLAEQLASGTKDALDLMARVGETVVQDGFDIEITDEMVDSAVEYANIITADRVALEGTSKKGASPVVGAAEMRVCASSVAHDLWGTSDFVLYQKGRKLMVYDYKYGKKVVEVEDNSQVSIYAIAVMDTLACWAFDEVELVIYQPRARHGDGAQRRWKTTIDHLRVVAVSLSNAVRETQQKDAELSAGDWCRWCPVQGSCPEKYKSIQQQAQIDFGANPALSIAPATGGLSAALPDARLMPAEKLGQAMGWEDAINSWFEAVKAVVREKLEAGEEVPGWKLVEGKSNRQWVSEDGVVAKYGQQFPLDVLYEKKLLSPAKMEKLVGKKNFDGSLTFKPEGKKSVAPSSDPRPEVKRSAQEDFAPLLPAPPAASELEKELLGL